MKKTSPSKIKNLEKILAVNATINSTLNLDELLAVIMNTAASVMRAKASSLMLLNDAGDHLLFKVVLGCKANTLKENFSVKIGEGIAGTVAKTGKSLIVNDTATDKRFAKRFDAATGFKTQAILCVPLRAKNKIIGILEAINPIGRKKFDAQDLKFFEVFADQAAIAVENARLHAEELKQEKAKQELLIAHEIQQSFLPDLVGRECGIDIAASSIPALAVGGDFYDVVKIDEAKTGILIGDVSGKGVPAALYMVRAISEFRALISQASQPGELLTALNNNLAKNGTRGMFITLIYLLADCRNKSLCLSSAGHHPTIRRNSIGAIELQPNPGGPPIGLLPGGRYEEITIPMALGDVFILYTDGVTEARNKKGEEYRYEGIIQSILQEQKSAQAYNQALLEDLKKFTDGAVQHDDITALTLMLPS